MSRISMAPHIVLGAYVVVFQVLDYAITLRCLSTGLFGEGGPLMALVVDDPLQFAMVKLAGTGGIICLGVLTSWLFGERLSGKIKSLQYMPYVAALLFYVPVLANNIKVYLGVLS